MNILNIEHVSKLYGDKWIQGQVVRQNGLKIAVLSQTSDF